MAINPSNTTGCPPLTNTHQRATVVLSLQNDPVVNNKGICIRLVFGLDPRHAYIYPIANVWPHPPLRGQERHDVTLGRDMSAWLNASGH